MSMSSFVYIIRNLINGKIYIGASKNDLHRLDEHKRGIKSNIHLQNALKAYGVQNFYFEMLEEHHTFQDALNAENELIEYFRYIGADLYNKNDGGFGCSNPSQETREKMRLAKLNKIGPRLGQHLSEESKEKIRKSLTGRKRGQLSQETKEKIRKANAGKKHKPFSEEARRKISESLKGKSRPASHGKIPWNKGKKMEPMDSSVVKKRADKRRGCRHTEETKEKMRKAAVLREAKKKEEERLKRTFSDETKEKMRLAAFIREAKKRELQEQRNLEEDVGLDRKIG